MVALIGGGVLTVAAAGVGVAYTIKANRADSDAASIGAFLNEQDPANKGGQCADPADRFVQVCAILTSKVNDANAARTTATVSFVAGGVFAAATVATYFLWPKRKKDQSHIAIVPWTVPDERGLSIVGEF